MLEEIRVPHRNITNNPPRILSAEETARRFPDAQAIQARAKQKKAQEPAPAKSRHSTKSLDHLFPQEVMAELYQRHIIDDGKSIDWLAKYNGIREVSKATIYRLLKGYGLFQPKPRGAKPAVTPVPAQAEKAETKPTAITQPTPAPAPSFNTNQLEAVQQLMATLQAANVTVTGRAVIDLHIEIDMGDQWAL